jgi:hypothetical protein
MRHDEMLSVPGRIMRAKPLRRSEAYEPSPEGFFGPVERR